MCWTTPQECVGYSPIVNCVISSDDCVGNVSTHFLNFMYRVCKGTIVRCAKEWKMCLCIYTFCGEQMMWKKKFFLQSSRIISDLEEFYVARIPTLKYMEIRIP